MDWFWLQSKYDSGTIAGTALRPKTGGDRGYFIGTEARYVFITTIPKTLNRNRLCAFFTAVVSCTLRASETPIDLSQLIVKF